MAVMREVLVGLEASAPGNHPSCYSHTHLQCMVQPIVGCSQGAQLIVSSHQLCSQRVTCSLLW